MLTLFGGSARAALFASRATTTGDWSQASTWTNDAVPGAGDDVQITNAGSVVIISSSSPGLNSLLISRILVFTNWNTTLSATQVWVRSNAVITCRGPFTNGVMSNNVFIVCSNLTVDAGGRIDVNGLGYAGGLNSGGSGPGGGRKSTYGCGAGYGGYGGGDGFTAAYGGLPYDLPEAPVTPGSGGGGFTGASGGAGGGAIRISAPGGVVTVNGTVAANASAAAVPAGCGGGSGGAVYITCARLAGSNGVLSATGGNGTGQGNGGGGRIAVIYDPAAQASVSPQPALRFSVLPGQASAIKADIGTLCFPDGALLPTTLGSGVQGQIRGFAAWSVDRLTVSNSWVRLAEEGFTLTVTQDLVVAGASGRLQAGGSVLVFPPSGSVPVPCNSSLFSSVAVGGNLLLNNGASLTLYSAPTGAMAAVTGALLNVNGLMSVASNSWLYLQSHPTNGGSPFLILGHVITSPGGGLNANAMGFSGRANGNGLGPGGGGANQGGSYGGVSGFGGTTYGSSNAPADPGSGGYGYSYGSGGNGGGLIRMQVAASVVNGGSFTANGSGGGGNGTSGGSGGGIYVQCRSLGGAGVFSAGGGSGYSSGGTTASGGGGGRIAIWRVYDAFTGTASATGGASAVTDHRGADGTIVWGQLPVPGALIMAR